MSASAAFEDSTRPAFTRAAGMLVYARDTQCFLALQHAKDGIWSIPGGVVRPHEHSLERAIRELREKTGFTEKLLTPQELPTNTIKVPGGVLNYKTYFTQIAHAFTPEHDPGANINHRWVPGFNAWPGPRRKNIDFLETNPECAHIIAQSLRAALAA
jgi:8-oxo-dGTP pyrophosphatase MutT (NUDIX family)